MSTETPPARCIVLCAVDGEKPTSSAKARTVFKRCAGLFFYYSNIGCVLSDNENTFASVFNRSIAEVSPYTWDSIIVTSSNIDVNELNFNALLRQISFYGIHPGTYSPAIAKSQVPWMRKGRGRAFREVPFLDGSFTAIYRQVALLEPEISEKVTDPLSLAQHYGALARRAGRRNIVDDSIELQCFAEAEVEQPSSPKLKLLPKGIRRPKRILWSSWSPRHAVDQCAKLAGRTSMEWLPLHLTQPAHDVVILGNGEGVQDLPSDNVAVPFLYEPVTVVGEDAYRKLVDEWAGPLAITTNSSFQSRERVLVVRCSGLWESDLRPINDLWSCRKDLLLTMCLSAGCFHKLKDEQWEYKILRSADSCQPWNFSYRRHELVQHLSKRLDHLKWGFRGRHWPDLLPEMSECCRRCYCGQDAGEPHEVLEFLARGKFALIVENTYDAKWSMGYVTEKLWNAWLAGSVPVYQGAYDIEMLVPKDCFIDLRQFESDDDLAEFLETMPHATYEHYREAIRQWLSGKARSFSLDSTFRDIENAVASL